MSASDGDLLSGSMVMETGIADDGNSFLLLIFNLTGGAVDLDMMASMIN